MSFTQTLLEHNRPIWDDCAATAFVQGLRTGTLPPEQFQIYMVQDSLYLKHYARVYGMAIYRAATLREIQLYYDGLSFVSDTESVLRLNYLSRWGMTDGDLEDVTPLPENRRYIDFLMDTARRGDGREILMAVTPCLLSYSYIFRALAADPAAARSPYWDFIQDYADDCYAGSCRAWLAFAEETCGQLPGGERERLAGIFRRASLLELDFWNMAEREAAG